eukprot:1645179-Alexandrium_andersonii.AAC.1
MRFQPLHNCYHLEPGLRRARAPHKPVYVGRPNHSVMGGLAYLPHSVMGGLAYLPPCSGGSAYPPSCLRAGRA